jgi:ABC-type hemin transport system ATPase subunit
MLSLSNPEIRFNLGTINWVVGLSGTDRKTVMRQSSTRYQPRRIYFFRLPISVIRHVELAKHDGLRNQYPYEILTVVSLALYPCLASVSISIILLQINIVVFVQQCESSP